MWKVVKALALCLFFPPAIFYYAYKAAWLAGPASLLAGTYVWASVTLPGSVPGLPAVPPWFFLTSMCRGYAIEMASALSAHKFLQMAEEAAEGGAAAFRLITFLAMLTFPRNLMLIPLSLCLCAGPMLLFLLYGIARMAGERRASAGHRAWRGTAQKDGTYAPGSGGHVYGSVYGSGSSWDDVSEEALRNTMDLADSLDAQAESEWNYWYHQHEQEMMWGQGSSEDS